MLFEVVNGYWRFHGNVVGTEPEGLTLWLWTENVHGSLSYWCLVPITEAPVGLPRTPAAAGRYTAGGDSWFALVAPE